MKFSVAVFLVCGRNLLVTYFVISFLLAASILQCAQTQQCVMSNDIILVDYVFIVYTHENTILYYTTVVVNVTFTPH